MPFPLSGKPKTVIIAKGCCAVPTDISYGMFFKAGVNDEFTFSVMDPCRSAVGGTVEVVTFSGEVIIYLACKIGQTIVSPINGQVVRVTRPYIDGEYSGLVIASVDIEVKMFYLQPHDDMTAGARVCAGQSIGMAQDVGQRYDGVTPHIHMEITKINPFIVATQSAAISGIRSGIAILEGLMGASGGS